MKRSSVIWFILGGIALIALAFVVGYVINGGLLGRGLAMHSSAMPFARAGRGMFVPGLFFGGLMLLGALIRWVGPIAGIVALIIVLTRRPAPAAPPAQVQAAPVATSAPADPPAETPTKPARKK